MHKNTPLIVALDMSASEAKALVKELGEHISFYKVGLELFLQSGKEILAFLYEEKKHVFLDLKFYDIPHTVKQAIVQSVIYPNIKFFTVHALGGKSMLEASVQIAKNTQALPIAVTILTSFSTDEWDTMIPTTMPLKEMAVYLAQYAHTAGIAGAVCSSQEASSIKKAISNKYITICPGIRPKGVDNSDQQRTMTPQEALLNGADYLVIGRPITQANNPREATLAILADL